jgi:dihydrofolate reductase
MLIQSPIAIIVAMDKNRGIGLTGKLPWKPITADLKHFKDITWGHPIIMGRKTHASIIEHLGHPLKGRKSIIVTRNPLFYFPPGSYSATSLEAAVFLADALNNEREKEIFVIGGAQIYAQALPLASRIYLTQIEEQFEADTFFPSFDENEWEVIERQERAYDHKSGCTYQFLTLERRKGDAAFGQ